MNKNQSSAQATVAPPPSSHARPAAVEPIADAQRKRAVSVARAHHGELFQGVVVDADGHLRRALVSLPCALYVSRASFEPQRDAPLTIETPWRTKALRAAELTLEHLGRKEWGGRLSVESNMPVRWGYGSSTSDVAAAVRAVASAFSVTLAPRIVARLAVSAECASDSSIFDDGIVLFAQREGLVVEDLGRAFPALEVLGFNTDPEGKGVDTLDFSPARYNAFEIEAFRPLIGMLRRAFHDGDATLLGRVATASARINQRFLPTPNWSWIEGLVSRCGAAGVQVAHSGTLVGLLFHPGQEARIREAVEALASAGITQTWRFSTADSRPTHENS